MPKCSECGFLARWDSEKFVFHEAHKFFRDKGRLESEVFNENKCTPFCFIQKADLALEIHRDSHGVGPSTMEPKVVAAMGADRVCDGFTSWIQGFHPKEQKQMLLNDEMVKAQQRHADASLKTATITARWTAAAVIIGALVALYSAKLNADATIKAVEKQIQSDRELADKK